MKTTLLILIFILTAGLSITPKQPRYYEPLTPELILDAKDIEIRKADNEFSKAKQEMEMAILKKPLG